MITLANLPTARVTAYGTVTKFLEHDNEPIAGRPVANFSELRDALWGGAVTLEAARALPVNSTTIGIDVKDDITFEHELVVRRHDTT